MKHSALLILVFFMSAGMGEAAGVKLEKLEDFNPEMHKITVNVEVDVKGKCIVGSVNLEQAFGGLLGVFGFQVASTEESQLEFAVSIKGFPSSDRHVCGLKVLSMARQVPEIKMLRLSPGSTSNRYRLWTVESIITSTQADVESLIQEQARRDVAEFTRALNR